MTEEPRHKRFGDTMSDYIVQVANELPYDAVGMWQIVLEDVAASISRVMR